jgi:hypothetical protein
MTDRELAEAYDNAESCERQVRRHLATDARPFEQDRGMAAYRGAVALRKALEHWITTRMIGPRQG